MVVHNSAQRARSSHLRQARQRADDKQLHQTPGATGKVMQSSQAAKFGLDEMPMPEASSNRSFFPLSEILLIDRCIFSVWFSSGAEFGHEFNQFSTSQGRARIAFLEEPSAPRTGKPKSLFPALHRENSTT